MAIEFELEQRIEAPPQRVWDVLVDVDAWQEWLPNLVRIERLTEGPLEPGSRWREVRKMFGREASEVFEVTAVEPGRRLDTFVDGAQGSSGRGEYRFVHRLEPDGPAATRLVLSGSVGGTNRLLELLGRLFAGAMKKAIARDLDALASRAEGPTASAGG